MALEANGSLVPKYPVGFGASAAVLSAGFGAGAGCVHAASNVIPANAVIPANVARRGLLLSQEGRGRLTGPPPQPLASSAPARAIRTAPPRSGSPRRSPTHRS